MQEPLKLADPSLVRFEVPCLKAEQPIGEFYVAVLPYEVLCAISDFDVRRVLKEDRDIERYLGIQRPLSKKREKELRKFVNFSDASFPTSIIISVDERCVDFDEAKSTMTLSNVLDEGDPILARQIAKVIDGQHRIAGLYNFHGEKFDCPVTILVGMDISDQSQIFARVNLKQTKVNPSLALDLFELSQSRSPQRTCHKITVKLDREKDSPFFKKIKRLGVATEGRSGELLTQSTVVKGLMPLISRYPDEDRDLFLRGRRPTPPDPKEAERLVFRQWFLEEEDDKIYEEIKKYFEAVSDKWPQAWRTPGKGIILPRTNGYLALMRLLRDLINYWTEPGNPVAYDRYRESLENVQLADNDFNVTNYKPGTSGEAKLYRDLREQIID